MHPEKAIIIGGGPAGLTAAYELLTRSAIQPVVLEMNETLGGISRTVNYKGNRMDIGGHRFFSKSSRVMEWWARMLPLQSTADSRFRIHYQGQSQNIVGTGSTVDPDAAQEVMLVRDRKSRIFFLRRFFDYPISLSARTIRNLGAARMVRIGCSYVKSRLFPIRREDNLEQFFINRFGGELYRTFFQSYTEKVWGVPCHRISAAWGAQRIKGLSITKALTHAIRRCFRRDRSVDQKGTETSLIEKFLYPKLGPGQMWETCGKKIEALGGTILTNIVVTRLLCDGNRITGVQAKDRVSGDEFTLCGDYVFSTMPVQELVRGLDCDVPAEVTEVSDGLVYRDFITVGLLVRQLRIHDGGPTSKQLLKDNWIYIQEPDVKVGRLQIFNNWSPYLVADGNNVWLGMEYFCNEGDDLWRMDDAAMKAFGTAELAKLGFIDASDVLDGTVLRVPKTYPAYFGSYERFDLVRGFLDGFENLFLVGRNGMHRYNNQDHSMLTAMVAVDNIIAGRVDKSNIWDVNTEQDYHEGQSQSAETKARELATNNESRDGRRAMAGAGT